jgi:putative ABC transport system permease protein
MDAIFRDLRMAIRALTRRKGVTALAILSLGLAIGFCTAGFSLVDAFVWRDLPVREPKRLTRVYARDREQRADSITWIEYQALASHPRFWEGLIAECRMGPRVRLADRDDYPITAGVSENYFDVLGVKPALGQVFHAGTGRDGTAVLSDHYWRTALGGDVHVVGRTLSVGQAVLTITGVLPAGFTGTNRGLLVELFVPPETFFGSLDFKDHLDQHLADFELVGRLRPGATIELARQEEQSVLRKLQADGLEPAPGRTAAVGPFVDVEPEQLALLMAPFLLVLLVAAANLANLRLIDNEARRRETAIRLALGAGRAHLLRQHWTETFLLCLTGTALGLLVASWLIDLVPAFLYAGENYIDYGVRLDTRTFAFTTAALLLVVTIGSLIPLSDAWTRRIIPGIQARSSAKASRWLSALVVGQMAFVTAVTCSAGLLCRSFQNVAAIRPAMDSDRRLLLLAGGASRPETLASALSGLPGVLRVAYARRAMLAGSGGGMQVSLEIPGQPKTSFHYDQVSPSYFATTGARILMGRPFLSSDGPRATPVALVSQAFVRRFIGGRNPIGAWFHIEGRDRQIVGVVEDGPSNYLKERIEPFFYFPFAQMPTDEITFFLECTGDPLSLAASVRTLARRENATFTLVDMHTMRQHMFTVRKEDAILTGLFVAMALLGLLLAAAGLFGVTSYAVSRRMREFGVRVALGATGQDLRRQVLRKAALQGAIGIPLGWGLALACRHLIQSLLYGVKATNPWMLVAASGVVALVALAAALRPAFTAARVDPVIALRCE